MKKHITFEEWICKMGVDSDNSLLNNLETSTPCDNSEVYLETYYKTSNVTEYSKIDYVQGYDYNSITSIGLEIKITRPIGWLPTFTNSEEYINFKFKKHKRYKELLDKFENGIKLTKEERDEFYKLIDKRMIDFVNSIIRKYLDDPKLINKFTTNKCPNNGLNNYFNYKFCVYNEPIIEIDEYEIRKEIILCNEPIYSQYNEYVKVSGIDDKLNELNQKLSICPEYQRDEINLEILEVFNNSIITFVEELKKK